MWISDEPRSEMGEYSSNTTRGSSGADLVRAGLIWSTKTRGTDQGEVRVFIHLWYGKLELYYKVDQALVFMNPFTHDVCDTFGLMDLHGTTHTISFQMPIHIKENIVNANASCEWALNYCAIDYLRFCHAQAQASALKDMPLSLSEQFELFNSGHYKSRLSTLLLCHLHPAPQREHVLNSEN